MINELSHNRSELKQLLKELYNYVQIHFRDEELYMKSIHYPLLDEHSAKHNAIIEEMTQIVRSSHSIADLSQHLFPFLKKWILEHVQTEDMKIKEFLEKQSSPASNS
jgi:hemerythrin